MEVERKQPQLVICFNQITPSLIKHFVKKGYINLDGSHTGNAEFMIAASPFNIELGKKHAEVKTFVDEVRKRKGAFNMPVYGEALLELVSHVISTDSAMPYHLGIDEVVIDKAKTAWDKLSVWLSTIDVNEFPEARDVCKRAAKFMNSAVKLVETNKKTLTFAEHREFLSKALGPDWKEVSKNLNLYIFLHLFGATDKLCMALDKATYVNYKEETTKLLNDVRWITKFMNLFQPTTEFNKGSVGDMLNFAAMFSGKTYEGDLDDIDTLNALRDFDANNPKLQQVTEAYFDMEPDDVAVLSYLHKHCKQANIVRVYPNETLSNNGESLLKSRLHYDENMGEVIIDKDLQNVKALEGIYKSK